MWKYNNTEIYHFGIKGMQWGHHKAQIKNIASKTSLKAEETAYSLGAKINPKELKYKIRKLTNNPNADSKLLAEYTSMSTKQSGILPLNKRALKAIETMGILAHKKAVYNNLDNNDLENLKLYTNSARCSRRVNSYLAIGQPKTYAAEAEKIKNTLRKNTVDNQTVYRTCNLKFSVNGITKKLNSIDENEMKNTIKKMSKNFSGKTGKENRIYSTSTSPLYAIDTWRAINPTASEYNTYMIMNCKKCPGVLADGKTSDGRSLVNTRSNQEAILSPNKITYKKIEFDEERNMFAITVDAT